MEHRYSDFVEESFELHYEPSWGMVHLYFVEPGRGTVHLLLDPSTGEVLARPSAQPFWVLEDGYVTHTGDPGGDDRVRYSYTGFDGSTERHVTADNGTGNADLHPGMATGEGVLRLHYLEDDASTRKPIMLEALSWEGGSHMIDPGFAPSGWQTGDGTAPADMFVPVVLPFPGAIAVLEEEAGATEMLGLT